MPQHTDDDRDADIDEKQRSTPNLRRIYDISAHDDPTELGWCVPSLLPTRLELKLSVRVSSEALPWGMSLLGTPTGHWASTLFTHHARQDAPTLEHRRRTLAPLRIGTLRRGRWLGCRFACDGQSTTRQILAEFRADLGSLLRLVATPGRG